MYGPIWRCDVVVELLFSFVSLFQDNFCGVSPRPPRIPLKPLKVVVSFPSHELLFRHVLSLNSPRNVDLVNLSISELHHNPVSA